jgi:dUTP pyrophosphatase
MQIKFKKKHPNAIVPAYAKTGDAGLDLTGITIDWETETQICYDTWLSVEIPEGYVGLIFPRSSIRNYELSLSNAVGVIDSGYRGSIKFIFNKLRGDESKIYAVGERIGQLIILPYPKIETIEVEELSNSERGLVGFGITGK